MYIFKINTKIFCTLQSKTHEVRTNEKNTETFVYAAVKFIVPGITFLMKYFPIAKIYRENLILESNFPRAAIAYKNFQKFLRVISWVNET
jgi:hypothetical protein